MCKNPQYIERENKYPTSAHPLSRLALVVPCGHCVECLKMRQQSFATRVYREAVKGDKLFFVTLTYNNEHLPLAKRLVRIDKDSGETAPLTPFEIMNREDDVLLDELRFEISLLPSTSTARHVYRLVHQSDDFLWRMEVTPSLNRLDVRNWLKKCRIEYKRKFGKALPPFKYAICGEYGPRGGRPHYHGLFFGLDDEQLCWLLARWDRKLGYVHKREVPVLNEDGSNARLLVSRYVGKYIAKGKFDLDSCRNGECEKGRLFNSKNLGTDLSDAELSYFRCYDLFGKYDLDEPEKTLNETQIKVLCNEIVNRSKLPLSGTADKDGVPVKVAIPRCLYRKIWYKPVERVTEWKYEKPTEYELILYGKSYVKKVPSKIERVLVSTKILNYVADISRSRFISRYLRKYREICPDQLVSECSVETYYEILKYSKSFETAAGKLREEDLLSRQYFLSEKDNQ